MKESEGKITIYFEWKDNNNMSNLATAKLALRRKL